MVDKKGYDIDWIFSDYSDMKKRRKELKSRGIRCHVAKSTNGGYILYAKNRAEIDRKNSGK